MSGQIVGSGWVQEECLDHRGSPYAATLQIKNKGTGVTPRRQMDTDMRAEAHGPTVKGREGGCVCGGDGPYGRLIASSIHLCDTLMHLPSLLRA